MKSFGISSLILSIVGVVIPIVGPFISGISGFLAIFSAGRGSTLGTAAIIINFNNIILLSPSLLISATGPELFGNGHKEQTQTIFWVLLGIQLVAMAVILSKKHIGKGVEQQPT